MGSCLSADGWGGGPQPHNQAALAGGAAAAASPGGYRRNRSVSMSLSLRRKNQYPNSYTGRGAAYDEISGKVPGRMLANGASNVASMFTQQGRKGTNQDAMIVWEDFGSRKDTIFCGVFDGHGPFGHLVARKVRDSLPSKLLSQWQASVTDDGNVKDDENASLHFEESVVSSADNNRTESFDGEEEGKHPEVFHTLKSSFTKAFKIMDKDLRVHPIIDCFCSGTTAVSLIKQGQDLVIGNIGDSRAVLGTRIDDKSLSAVQLTVDLKPNLPQEAERIRKCKGRVFALHDEPEVARVWLPNNDSPGLAMARAFGDFCLKEFGLISVPEVSYRRLTEKDEFIVLATDGIWDVLSNKEVVDIVAAQPSRSNAAKVLVEYAVRSWRSKYPTSKVDDCAVVCLFLNNPPSDEQVPREITSVTSVASHGSKQNDGKSDLEANSFYFERNSVRNMTNSMDAPDDSGCYVKIQSQDKVYHVDACDQDGWLAVESVTRVNSLINIPRNEGASKTEGLSKCF